MIHHDPYRICFGGVNGLCHEFNTTNHDMQELAEEFGRHRAREFNVGVERRDTGVRFEDVAGIDDVKADIEEVMKMILGDAEYTAMGARAPRVCSVSLLSRSIRVAGRDNCSSCFLCMMTAFCVLFRGGAKAYTVALLSESSIAASGTMSRCRML